MKIILELGKYLRKRYDDFISSDYIPQEILVKSTDYDRTIQSAHANLGSFYNITGEYFPIPIHSIKKEDEESFRFPVQNCPKYEKVISHTKTLNELNKRRELNINFQSTLSRLSQMAELKEKTLKLTDSLTDRISDSIDCHWDNDMNG